ncbi:hypothetical protein [Nocardioides sp.]|uniref:hypothetical protein n=1 Tax=Nocardioides sp. TaxID=35761 RepID=UPI00260B1CCB|nr:hypothetical protein [Nocardioides sp.]
MCSLLRARFAALFFSVPVIALCLAALPAAHADGPDGLDRSAPGALLARSSSYNPWYGYLWPASGLTCSYAPASSYSTPQATYAVTARDNRHTVVRVKAGSARATEEYTFAEGDRLRLQVRKLSASGVTLRMSGGILLPALRGVKNRRSVKSTVVIKATLPKSQAAQVKPYLTSGSTVNLRVTFKAKGQGVRTVQGYHGASVRISVASVRATNVVSAAQSTVVDAARQYLAPMTGTQVYAESFGLVSVGGAKADGSDGLLLSGCH